MNKLQNELYSLLVRTTDILKKYQIRYWVAFGTVLGAERHKGFIPWDDDVDIYIDGKDYNQVLELFRKGPIDDVSLHDVNTIDEYPYWFPKLVDTRTILIERGNINTKYRGGIYIDLFPVFSVKDNIILRKIDQFSRYLNYAIIRAHYHDFSQEKRHKKQIVIGWLNRFDCKKAQYKLMERYSLGIKGKGNFVQDCTKFNDEFLHKRIFFENADMVIFEGSEFRAPFNHIEYLMIEYGDYAELPPVEKRVARHNFEYIRFSDGKEECYEIEGYR